MPIENSAHLAQWPANDWTKNVPDCFEPVCFPLLAEDLHVYVQAFLQCSLAVYDSVFGFTSSLHRASKPAKGKRLGPS